MAYDASGNENSFFFLSEHVKDRGCGYDSAFSGSCGYDFAFSVSIDTRNSILLLHAVLCRVALQEPAG